MIGMIMITFAAADTARLVYRMYRIYRESIERRNKETLKAIPIGI